MSRLTFTGERFIPGTRGEIWIEHWHRYHFASRWAAGKRVLDVACGEGYGSALLARVAKSVVGADISSQAVAHARTEYAGLLNATFVQAPCNKLPLPDAIIDLAVSFETIEHIAEQELFIDELARVLAPGGMLLISSPNKLEYSDKRNFTNEFHVKELYRVEFTSLLRQRFETMQWYGQLPNFYSVIAPEGGHECSEGQLVEVAETNPANASPRLDSPLYFIVACARDRAALDAVTPAVSVLSDRDQWMYHDYGQTAQDAAANHQRAVFAEGIVYERDQQLLHLRELQASEREAAERAYDELRRVSDDHRASLEAALVATRAAAEDALAQKQHEIDRRGGLRWWLRLPLVRLGILKH